jgi:nitroreductase
MRSKLASVLKGDQAMSTSRENQTGAAAGQLAPEQITRVAVAAAVLAPSVHNTQPWWFSEEKHEISVHADIERRLEVADPGGREMLISCGAALFNVRAALRHLGYVPVASILPDPDRPGLVARVRWDEQVPTLSYEEQLYSEIQRRHTHRDGFLPEPPPARVLKTLGEEAAREGAVLRIAGTDDARAALAAAVTAAEHAAHLDSARTGEMARWTRPPHSRRRDGVPATAYPARPGHSEPDFPGRDFAHGQGWGLPPSMMAPLHRSAGVVALLATSADQPADWIRSGQALQRVLLAASVNGVAAALHSQPLELPELREFIRIRLGSGVYPQMLLRFGATDKVTTSTRRPVEEVLL